MALTALGLVPRLVHFGVLQHRALLLVVARVAAAEAGVVAVDVQVVRAARLRWYAVTRVSTLSWWAELVLITALVPEWVLERRLSLRVALCVVRSSSPQFPPLALLAPLDFLSASRRRTLVISRR